MEEPLQETVSGLLKKFSSSEGDQKLQVASLWEKCVGDLTQEAQIFKIENKILFIKVPHSVLAQELKLKIQRKFMVAYEEMFEERLKDIRFLIVS